MKLLLFLFVVFFLGLCFKYRSFKNPYKLFMIFGKKGCGKSSYLCKLAHYYQKRGYVIYTNMSDICIKDCRIIDASLLGDFVPVANSVVLLDEVGMLYDNRDFKSFRHSVRDFFKLQRHYKVIVYLASQSFDIDKKLRDLTDRMFLLSSITPWLTLIRPITKKISLVEASSMGESRIVDNLSFGFITSWKLFLVPKYSKYFNSFLAPEKPILKYSEPSNPLAASNSGTLKTNFFKRRTRPTPRTSAASSTTSGVEAGKESAKKT